MNDSSSSPQTQTGLKSETVYGDGSSFCDGASVESGDGSPMHSGQTVISEKVRSLANNVYREFEALIDVYGRDVVQNLMPLVVACLENLDRLYTEKTDLEVEMDLLKEDNNQLINQFEKERLLRKAAEEKILQTEDRHEECKNEMTNKLEAHEASIKVMEMKLKSAQDHISRLEDKEADAKRENTRLHERYNELLRNHMEAVERGKAIASVNDADSLSLGSQSISRMNVHHHHHHHHRLTTSETKSSERSKDVSSSKREHDDILDSDVEELGESLERELTTSGNISSEGNWEENREDLGTFEPDSSMFEEMPMPDEADVQSDDGQDCLDDQDYESEFGMSREIDNLIQENMELVETKNALNIVKDDLITQLDDLTGENEMLRDEVNSLTEVKARMKARIRHLEAGLKETKYALEKAHKKIEDIGEEEEEEAEGVANQTQRRRFTRKEFTRVLTERNQFKERLMELEDAVRWTEMMRAKRDHPELVADSGAGSTSGRRSMWKYFSTLFGGGTEDESNTSPTPPPTPARNVINANASPATTSTPISMQPKTAEFANARRTSGASTGSLSAASSAFAAVASFLAPSPSATMSGNPLFMTPLPSSRSLTFVTPTAASNGSSSESTQLGLASATIPKLVTHDVRLVPVPRGPGSAVKRVQSSNEDESR